MSCPTCDGTGWVRGKNQHPCPYCTPRPTSNLDDDADQELEALRATVVAQAVRITTLTAELASARLALTTRSST